MAYIKLPDWLWHVLITINVFNFVVGFIVADRQLMFLALISGICCWLGYKTSNGEKEDE